MKNILLVAAENSAETYAVQVVKEFSARGDFRFWGIGGDRLAACGCEIVVHNRSLSVVGIVEVLSHLWRIRGIMKRLYRQARERRADAALLIDYPDFNLRLARRLRRAGIPVYYYISPTVWAWRYGRVAQIRRWVTRLFVIFPFEVPIYEKEGVAFTYTGHPLLSEVRVREPREEFRRRHGVGPEDLLLALLPGSRESEVNLLLPEILEAVRRLRREFTLHVFLLRAQNISPRLLAAVDPGIRVLDQEQGFDLLHAADTVITTCGTSNLEACLLDAPFVAVYKVNRLTYFLGHRFLRIGLYSIVNILAGPPGGRPSGGSGSPTGGRPSGGSGSPPRGRPSGGSGSRQVVAELIQGECRADRICAETRLLLADPAKRMAMRREFARIRESLQQEERPAVIICRQMLSELDKRQGD